MWVLICLILVHKVNSIATDSFDVTLVFEDSKFNQAHKVVLATSIALRTHPSYDEFVGFHEDVHSFWKIEGGFYLPDTFTLILFSH